MTNRYLNGENIKPIYNSDAKKLIGKKVKYLRNLDIDKSGRGYYFPRIGEINGVLGRNVIINDEYISFSSIIEMEDLGHAKN